MVWMWLLYTPDSSFMGKMLVLFDSGALLPGMQKKDLRECAIDSSSIDVDWDVANSSHNTNSSWAVQSGTAKEELGSYNCMVSYDVVWLTDGQPCSPVIVADKATIIPGFPYLALAFWPDPIPYFKGSKNQKIKLIMLFFL